MTLLELRDVVEGYLDELSYNHPFVGSKKFVDNSYGKWACKEIIKAIDKARDLPFDLTSFEVLEQFIEKMKTYAYMNSKNSLGFVIAQETAEYLIEQYWVRDYKRTIKRGNERRKT